MAYFFRAGVAFSVAALWLAAPAFADHQPAIVMPNGRGAPPLINGYDATGAIIEGDWGLYRPGHGTVTIYPNGGLLPAEPAPAHYFPYTGHRPRSGRYEVEPRPGRRLPPPAPSYHRSWSTQSDMTAPVTVYTPFDPPAVIQAVPWDRRKHRPRRPRPHVR